MFFGESNPNDRSTSVAGRECRILVADHSSARRRQIATALGDLTPAIDYVTHTTAALEHIDRFAVDLLITDIQVHGIGGIELCRRFKSSSSSERIPVLLLARAGDVESEFAAFDAGADGFLMGPFRPEAFRARAESCLRQKALIDSMDETEKVLFSLAQSVEGRDPNLGMHCERLALIAVTMGLELGLSGTDVVALQRGGFLHDVGKVAIPDSILLKPGPLTPEEWVVMKTHPERGERICSGLRSLRPVLPIIRHHHERWDGSGYPDGLKGEDIPLLARILQFADIYDALTADRPYKRPFSTAQALDIMRSEVTKGWRDPKLMAIFEQVVPLFADQDSTVASLQALARAIERSRKNPNAPVHFQAEDFARSSPLYEFAPVKLVSGL